MMRFLSAVLALGIFTTNSTPVAAQQPAVLVELYTSQGCSSCPPADALLNELAMRDDVIALALHVDYWDYIGWKDIFADPMHAKRQKLYARVAGKNMIYTPQFIVHGQTHVTGNQPMLLAEHIQAVSMKMTQSSVGITAEFAEGVLRVQPASPVLGATVLQVVTFKPSETVDIQRGENRGHKITYSNIVTSWAQAEDWNGTDPVSVDVALKQGHGLAVLLQRPGPGEILTALRLR